MNKKIVGRKVKTTMADTDTTQDSSNKTNPVWGTQYLPYIFLTAGLLLIVWLILRNEPFKEAIFAYALRVFLSVCSAYSVQVVPGFLNLEISQRGRRITAGGAFAFAIITFFGAPVIAPTLDPENIRREPPRTFPCRVWLPENYSSKQVGSLYSTSAREAGFWVSNLIDQHEADKAGYLSQQPNLLRNVVKELQTTSLKIDFVEKKKDEKNKDELVKIKEELNQQTNKVQEIANQLGELLPSTQPLIVIAETDPFESPYDAFSASVSTLTSATGNPSGSHKISAFLVRKKDAKYTFEPLLVLHSSQLERNTIHVPASNSGDQILLVIKFILKKDDPFPKRADQIPVQIIPLN
ncbi:hypothetical protein [Gimesia aquarii]|uniref:Uncharacterized protein n=1 Tax=Gimesia aquarii TaxID=2527964 RepID=A0A517W0A6_9PLAN|nr:hypothetical protein [Gimesia aquarii]QDT98676.1 hypothetical protein V144x_41830 [Gimesia aquarii]